MVEPFRINVSDEVLHDLARRLRHARLPEAGGEGGWRGGMNPGFLRSLVSYWRDGYDWRTQEAQLNRLRHFRCEVDGTRLHFIHEKGRGPAPLPLILTHGYPDSFFRFDKLIALLADPGAHGGDPADAFDVVVPSLPGYAFSAPRERGGGIFGFGSLFHRLMTEELGYGRYGAHGGDWGSFVTEQLARAHPSALIGVHLTDIPFWHLFQKPDRLSAAERKYLDANEEWQKRDGAYAMIQGTRPRTAAAALRDSPIGLAAWIVEKFQEWSDCGDDPERSFSKDDLLTNVMIYWVTDTIESSFQPYADVMNAGAARWIAEVAKEWLGAARTPAGFALFPKDIAHPPREWAERFFDVQRWTPMPAGGHFAALEAPDQLARELRAFFRPLRSAVAD